MTQKLVYCGWAISDGLPSEYRCVGEEGHPGLHHAVVATDRESYGIRWESSDNGAYEVQLSNGTVNENERP